ncbi:MAG: GGDEF domain-containing protein [Colwellia sp.]|nr:GGDEF domain-containing protein [Colwellia sp.]
MFVFIYFCLAKVTLAAFSPESSKITGQHSSENLVEFDKVAIDIENLMDSNALLALSQLKEYEEKFYKLSLKQQINYYNLLAGIYLLQAQYHLVEKTASDGLALTLGLSSPSIFISELLYSRGFAYESIGKTAAATKDYENGLELAKSLHDKVLIATGLINLGAIYYLTDQYENSLRVLNDAYNIAKQTNNDELKGSVNSELGILYAHLNRAEQSMVYYQQSYQFYKSANKKISSLEALVNIGINHLNNNKYQQAIIVYETIIAESGGSGQNEIIYNTYSGLSRAYLQKQQPDPEASYQYLLLSKQYMENTEQHNIELQYYNEEAFVLFALARFEDVLVSINKVEKILKDRVPLSFVKAQKNIKLINLKSKTYFKLGYYQQAYKIQKQRLASIKALRKREQISSIAEVRLALEVKQADLQTKLLENKQISQETALLEAEKQQQQQRYYLLYTAVVALIFAWLLIKLIQDQRRLYKVSNIDLLTGIANRKKTLKTGKLLFKKAKLQQSDLSVLMIDIDHLKTVNNQFGHGVGDVTLQKMVQLGSKLIRKTDFFGRISGEEFLLFLPKTSHAQALIIAERFRFAVKQLSWQQEGASDMAISVSIGVVCSTDLLDNQLSDIEALINKADRLLYQAKAQGSDKVCG